MDTYNREVFFELIKNAVWGSPISGVVDWPIYEEMKNQAVFTLSANVLDKMEMPEDLCLAWKTDAYIQIANYYNYRYFQKELPITVPYVVLKGTTAAKYYPNPEFRIMGDIDIMTRREDFEEAFQQLLDEGYQIQNNKVREIVFVKDNIVLELHCSFAKLNNPAYARFLDDLIISNINPTHELPDDVNGLVLLEHISQHLVAGLGLRQVIDWMMFVDKCLPDEKWPAFRRMTINIGLEKLAIVTTRMCEIYLGLPHREWCSSADEDICHELMDYILNCGNFGNKRKDDRSISENIFVYARNPIAVLKLLQTRGMVNWTAGKRYVFLRPFAWIYQAGRYIKRGLSQPNASVELKTAYVESRKRRAMFDALGVRQDSKGLVIYKDGKYVKE